MTTNSRDEETTGAPPLGDLLLREEKRVQVVANMKRDLENTADCRCNADEEESPPSLTNTPTKVIKSMGTSSNTISSTNTSTLLVD
jgi:hypothetical protein